MPFFSAFISRILAALVISLLGYIADRFHVKYTPADMNAVAVEVVHFMVTYVIPFIFALFSVLKVWGDKHFNPANASATQLVKEGRAVSTAIDQLEAAKKGKV